DIVLITFTQSGQTQVIVTQKPSWSQMFRGEKITLTCEVQGGEGVQWEYQWRTPQSETSWKNNKDWTIKASISGEYSCKSRSIYDSYSSTNWSETVKLSVSVIVTQKPSWSQMFRGETITLTCEVQGDEGVQWMYQWRTPQSQTSWRNNKDWTITASITGEYSCKSRSIYDSYSSTNWSENVTLSLSGNVSSFQNVLFHMDELVLKCNKPGARLTAGTTTVSVGDNVTLICSVDESAGWKYEWFRRTSNISEYRIYGGENGEIRVSQGGIYSCRGFRGEPAFYSDTSDEVTINITHLHPSASLSVSPDRVQHFTSDSVSLTCEGNSAEWRVGSFLLPDLLSFCSDWGTMNGSTCHVQKIQSSNAVFWCESGSAFSNAVNITGHYDDLILLSPVHPVTEGHSVTLGCKWRTENLLSKVFFYQNDTLIQSESRVEMIIPAVSKSHEGFYKCQSSGKESPQSWLAVTCQLPKASLARLQLVQNAVARFICGVKKSDHITPVLVSLNWLPEQY
uniref:Ig-like domain-containing protein n=1 Tax=Oryzias melastigma TaxID=30732 RepID=A0A3B3CG20_ORYME